MRPRENKSSYDTYIPRNHSFHEGLYMRRIEGNHWTENRLIQPTRTPLRACRSLVGCTMIQVNSGFRGKSQIYMWGKQMNNHSRKKMEHTRKSRRGIAKRRGTDNSWRSKYRLSQDPIRSQAMEWPIVERLGSAVDCREFARLHIPLSKWMYLQIFVSWYSKFKVGAAFGLCKSLTCHELIAKHFQVLFHTTEESIIDICLINILQKITDRCKCENECIHLKEQPALLWWKFPCIPDIALPRSGGFCERTFVWTGHIYALRSGDSHMGIIPGVPHLQVWNHPV